MLVVALIIYFESTGPIFVKRAATNRKGWLYEELNFRVTEHDEVRRNWPLDVTRIGSFLQCRRRRDPSEDEHVPKPFGYFLRHGGEAFPFGVKKSLSMRVLDLAGRFRYRECDARRSCRSSGLLSKPRWNAAAPG